MKKENLFAVLPVFIFSFILNFVWENLHFSLYAGNSFGFNSHLALMLYASLVDAFFILLVFLFIGLINKKINWKLNKKNLVLFSAFLISISLLIEIRALITGRWVYSSNMPTILGIGLSPLVQLALTGLISIFFLKSANLQ